MNAPSKFWLVWRDCGGASTKKHTSPQAAYTESRRLAKENPGTVFFVLEAVQASRATDPVETVEISDVPF